MGIHTLFLDMDEVLVDFVGGVCELFAVHKETLQAYWKPGDWSMVPALDKAVRLGEDSGWADEVRVDDDLLWDVINENSPDFWVDLRPLPWASELLDLVERTGLEFHIVSAPSREVSSYTGKVEWLKSYFGKRYGRDFSNFVLTHHKHIFAQPDTILIDDRAQNCERFSKPNGRPGGHSIIFPTQGNYLHDLRSDPITHVRNKLEQLKCIYGFATQTTPSVR